MSINASDFNPASSSGTITVNSSAGTTSTIIAADQTTEGPEKFVVKLRTGSITGPVVATSTQIKINDTSVSSPVVNPGEPTYSFQSNVSSASEGQGVRFTLVTTDVTNGTTIPYSITGVSSADIGGANTTGNFTISNNTATLDLAITADQVTEGNETLTITLTTVPNNPSISITIVDSSVAPPVPVATYELKNAIYGNTPATTSTVNEGTQNVVFYLSITNGGNLWGTQVPYTITGVSSADIGGAMLNQHFQIPQNPTSNPVATATFNITADQITEGTETMVVTLDGLNVSSSVIINDTSSTPANPPTYSLSVQTGSGSSVNEGSSMSFILTTTNVTNGTNVPFTVTGIQQSDITGLAWDSGNSRFQGSFTVNNNTASVTITIVADLTTEGSETATLNLTNGQASTSVTINDTSGAAVTTGSATITAANTRAVPTTLPAAETWLVFRMIGAGGSGGGGDGLGGAGGSGGGGQYARGIVKLPATSGPKTIYGFVGRPGRGGRYQDKTTEDGGTGENCSPVTDASGAFGQAEYRGGSSGGGGAGGGGTSLYYKNPDNSFVPITFVGGGGGGGGGTLRRGDYGNANWDNKGFITFGAGVTGTTAAPGLPAIYGGADGGAGGGGGGGAGAQGYAGHDNNYGSKGGSAGYVIRNDSNGLTWNTFDWYGIGPVPPSTTSVAAEAPQPYPWVSFGRGGIGAVDPTYFGQGGQMGAIAMYWTTATTAPSYSDVPAWAFPVVTVPSSAFPVKDLQCVNTSRITFWSWGAYTLDIDNNKSTNCFISHDWGNDPINGIGEFLEIKAVSKPPSNAGTPGSYLSNIPENTWTPMTPNGFAGYYFENAGYWGTVMYIDIEISIRRRDTGAVLNTVRFYNVTQTQSTIGQPAPEGN